MDGIVVVLPAIRGGPPQTGDEGNSTPSLRMGHKPCLIRGRIQRAGSVLLLYLPIGTMVQYLQYPRIPRRSLL
jgi:hypothetical protein